MSVQCKYRSGPGTPSVFHNAFVCVCASAGNVCVFVLAVKEGAREDWCLIGACRRDLLLPLSARITSSHPAQSYCLAVSQSL